MPSHMVALWVSLYLIATPGLTTVPMGAGTMAKSLELLLDGGIEGGAGNGSTTSSWSGPTAFQDV